MDGAHKGIQLAEFDDHNVVGISGSFAFHLQSDFRKAYESISKTTVSVVLDFGGVDYMDSSGLGMLLVMKKYLDDAKVSYEITNSRDQTLDLLKMTHFDKFFKINGDDIHE